MLKGGCGLWGLWEYTGRTNPGQFVMSLMPFPQKDILKCRLWHHKCLSAGGFSREDKYSRSRDSERERDREERDGGPGGGAAAAGSSAREAGTSAPGPGREDRETDTELDRRFASSQTERDHHNNNNRCETEFLVFFYAFRHFHCSGSIRLLLVNTFEQRETPNRTRPLLSLPSNRSTRRSPHEFGDRLTVRDARRKVSGTSRSSMSSIDSDTHNNMMAMSKRSVLSD